MFRRRRIHKSRVGGPRAVALAPHSPVPVPPRAPHPRRRAQTPGLYV